MNFIHRVNTNYQMQVNNYLFSTIDKIELQEYFGYSKKNIKL